MHPITLNEEELVELLKANENDSRRHLALEAMRVQLWKGIYSAIILLTTIACVTLATLWILGVLK